MEGKLDLNLDQNLNENSNSHLNEKSNIIAITACLKRCSVAIKYDGEIFESNEDADAPTYLASILQRLIEDNGIDLKKIAGVITASGPGSFTGIRTAQSLTKAIALTLEIPAASVDYFDIIERLSEQYKIPDGTERIFVIKTDKNQAYYRIVSGLGEQEDVRKDNWRNWAKNEGVCDYKTISQKTTAKNLVLVGEDILEISANVDKERYLIINDFRRATNLFAFWPKISADSKVNILYINAR